MNLQKAGIGRTSSGLGGVSSYASPAKALRGGGDHVSVRMQTWIVLELAHLGSLQVSLAASDRVWYRALGGIISWHAAACHPSVTGASRRLGNLAEGGVLVPNRTNVSLGT